MTGFKLHSIATRSGRYIMVSRWNAQVAQCHDRSKETESRSSATVQFCVVSYPNEPVERTASLAGTIHQRLTAVANDAIRQHLRRQDSYPGAANVAGRAPYI